LERGFGNGDISAAYRRFRRLRRAPFSGRPQNQIDSAPSGREREGGNTKAHVQEGVKGHTTTERQGGRQIYIL